MLEIIEQHARQRQLSLQDALQVFLQVIVLQHLRHPTARLIGGTALTLGHGNPRFSEDLDLAGVAQPQSLQKDLSRAAKDVSQWLDGRARLATPRGMARTWRLHFVPTGAKPSDRHWALHIDSEPDPPHSTHPIVIEYPGIPPFLFPSIALSEILANKLLALAYRKYVGGRDVFDLWYHWFRLDDRQALTREIWQYLPRKLTERGQTRQSFHATLTKKLAADLAKRTVYEWQRYVPATFRAHLEYATVRSQLMACLQREEQ